MTSTSNMERIDCWGTIHEAAVLTEKTLKDITQLIHDEPNCHGIRLAVEAFKENEYKRIASAISIKQLNRDKIGIRISAIENAGFKNLFQIKDISYQQLLAIPGIGRGNASLILNSINRLDSEVKQSIIIDLEKQSITQMESIILECYKYSNSFYLWNTLKNVLSPIEKQLRDSYEVLHKAEKRFSWFMIISKKRRCKIYKEAIKVKKVLSGNLQDVLQISNEYKRAVINANISTAIGDYEKKKEQYAKCISSYTPVSGNNSLYNLPQITAGNSIDDSFDVLPDCSHGGIAAIASFLIIICLICVSIVKTETNKRTNYTYGISYATNGNYEEAYSVFERMQEYRDAKIWLTFCDYAEEYSVNDTYVGGEEELANLSFTYDTQYQGLINKLYELVKKLADIKREQEYDRLLQEHPEYAVPKSDIHISIPYKTHYLSGVVEYGVYIDNKTDYDIIITSVTIAPTIPDYEETKHVSVNITVDAQTSLSTSIDIGSGQKRNGGSMTMKGTVYGTPAYYCSSFDFKLNE